MHELLIAMLEHCPVCGDTYDPKKRFQPKDGELILDTCRSCGTCFRRYRDMTAERVALVMLHREESIRNNYRKDIANLRRSVENLGSSVRNLSGNVYG